MSAPDTRPVFLAPHYDDATLSCGGTLAAMAASGERPLVLTVFGGEPTDPLNIFATEMHEQWGLSPESVIEDRRNEERCAASILGIDSAWLNLPDAIYRGERYMNDEQLFGAVHPEEATYYRDIRDVISTFFDENNIAPHTLYCPLAVGNHVDHQLVLVTARTLHYHGQRVVAWEDFPYAGDPGVSVMPIGQRRARGHPIIRPLSEAELQTKIKAINCYASQIDVIFRHQGGDPAKATRSYLLRAGSGRLAERFWPLAR